MWLNINTDPIWPFHNARSCFYCAGFIIHQNVLAPPWKRFYFNQPKITCLLLMLIRAEPLKGHGKVIFQCVCILSQKFCVPARNVAFPRKTFVLPSEIWLFFFWECHFRKCKTLFLRGACCNILKFKLCLCKLFGIWFIWVRVLGMFFRLNNTNSDSSLWKYHVSSGMTDNGLLEYRRRQKGIWQV